MERDDTDIEDIPPPGKELTPLPGAAEL